MSYSNPIFDINLAKQFIYDIDIMDFKDNESVKEIKKMIVKPVVLGNYVDFTDKAMKRSFLKIAYSKIIDIKTASESAGFFKKNDQYLELVFDENDVNNTIKVNVNDKQIDEIKQNIINAKTQNQSFWETTTIDYELDGESSSAIVHYKAPYLSANEELLWFDQETSGVIQKHLKFVTALTNFRAIIYNFETNSYGCVLLRDVDDVLVMNKRTLSESSRTGTFVGAGRYSGFGGVTMSYGTGKSRVVGDVVFLVNGKQAMSWGGIVDPTGVSRLAKSVIKELYPKKKITKSSKKTQKNKRGVEKAIAKTIVCDKCGNSISADSKFCNDCGSKVEQVIAKGLVMREGKLYIDTQNVKLEGILKCYTCNTLYRDSTSICPKCGNALQNPK